MSHCRLLSQSARKKRWFRCDSSHLNLDTCDQLDDLHLQTVHFPQPKGTWGDQLRWKHHSHGYLKPLEINLFLPFRLSHNLSSFALRVHHRFDV